MNKYGPLYSFLASLAVALMWPTIAHADNIAVADETVLGPNVYVFTPDMPSEAVQQTLDAVFRKMETNHFGRERYALLFAPGTYRVNFCIGFYTHVAGLGRNPDDVHIDGGVTVNAKWDPNGHALNNFWRVLENLSVTPSAKVPYLTELGITRIAVSQAAPLRRLHIRGELQLFDWGPHGNVGYASGGFLADSIVDGKVVPASQQQWLSRNSAWQDWTNAVWNMVFVGCENAPENTFPEPAYTVIDRAPLIREKPYLFIDEGGRFRVFVPALQKDRKGVSWRNAPTPGESLPLEAFYIANPNESNSDTINAALKAGKHVLFTPGIYPLREPLRVVHPKTILLGLGLPSLVPTTGQPAVTVADVDGATIAGLILDAGVPKSTCLLEIGPPGSTADHSADPTFLYDLTVRTGGPTAGLNDVGVVINSNHTVVDHIWIWRADHGDGVGWNTNPTKNGLVVNGDGVVIYGLFNEHHEEYQTVWNGEGGRVYMYQSEMPYDVPDQQSWRHGTTNGFASYKVADHVTTHEAWGIGVYCYFRDAPIKARSAVEAPTRPGIRLHHLTTIWLDGTPGSEIAHIVNDLGGRVYAPSPPEAQRQTWKEFGGH
ncbi:hypothetical protein JCM19992_13290 [Thermostilla marina]